MVELRCALAPVVATDDALAARLGDQPALDLAPPPPHPFKATALTPVVATALQNELGLSVLPALERCFSPSIIGSVVPVSYGLEVVPLHPVPNRGQASIHLLRDFTEGHSKTKKSFELILRGRTLRGMFLGLGGRKPVLLQPVADRRFVFADALADRFER